MVDENKEEPATIGVTVELFGMARIIAGRYQVIIRIGESTDSGEVAKLLALACPELVGKVILDDRTGLQDSYILNLNGTEFADRGRFQLKQGDSLLLFSSQAGG